jgi:hypothetical protein
MVLYSNRYNIKLSSRVKVRTMALSATFNNISVMSSRSLLIEEHPGKTTDLPEVTEKLVSHSGVSSTPRLSRTD